MRVRRIGIEQVPSIGTGDHGIRQRHRRRACAGRPLRIGVGSEELVHDRGREDPARSALVDRRPDVRRALHVLDRHESGLQRALDVGDRLVALQVHEVRRVVPGGFEPEGLVPGKPVTVSRPDRLEPGRRVAVRPEGRQPLVVTQAAADRSPQGEVRVPAAGDQQQIAIVQGLGDALSHAEGPHDVGAARPELVRRSEARIVRGEDRGAIPGKHCEALDVGRRRGREHHSGSIIAGERDEALVRPGREHDPGGANVPETLERGGALVCDDVAVVVHAERGRAGEHGHAVRRLVDAVALVQQDHAVAAARRGGRGFAPGGTATHDEGLDVHVPVHGLDRRDLRRIGKTPHPGPRLGDEPVHQFDHRRGDDRVEPGFADLDEGVRLLGPRGHHAPRTAEDRAREAPHHAVRQEGTRERVAFEPLVFLVIEPEPQRSRAVDPGAAGIEPSAHAGGSSPIRYVARNRYVAVSRIALNQRRQPWT